MDEATKVIRTLKWVGAVCFLFMAVEVVGGLIANSIAIMSDAMHLFSDLMAFAISGYSVWLSKQQSPPYLTFGYHKIQTLGALINIAIIWVVTIILLIEATERVINKEAVKEPKWMLYTSIFGILCNLVMVKIIHSDTSFGHQGCSHGHQPHPKHSQSSDKSKTKEIVGYESINDEVEYSNRHVHGDNCSHHHHTEEKPALNKNMPQEETIHQDQHSNEEKHVGISTLQSKQHSHSDNHEHQCGGHHDHTHHEPANINLQGNLNIEAAYVHILGDIIQSVGVAISATVIYFNSTGGTWNYYHLADPLCTYLFSVLVALTTVRITKKSIIILLDGCCDPKIVEEIEKDLEKLPKLTEFSQLKIRSISTSNHLASVKISSNTPDTVDQVRAIFSKKDIPVVIQWEMAQQAQKIQ